METNEPSIAPASRKTEDRPSLIWTILIFLIALGLPVAVFLRAYLQN